MGLGRKANKEDASEDTNGRPYGTGPVLSRVVRR